MASHWRMTVDAAKFNIREAVDSEDGKLWKKAMDEEMAALDKNKDWNLVEL
jgi:hypothetical protein